MALGGLIFLDMIEDARLLVDRGGFLSDYLGQLAEKLRGMNSVKVRRGSTWHWVIKPDLKPGEVFDV